MRPPWPPPPEDARRLHPQHRVWIDAQRGRVIADGRVSLQEGILEMFACPRGTKEHESIVAVETEVFIIHAALLTLGAEPGSPAKFVPDYAPPSGPIIDVSVGWQDTDGRQHQVAAQEWIRDVKTGETLSADWVFAGSSFWRDEVNDRTFYQAEAGFFICVANFGTAMLDLPLESSDASGAHIFEAHTERIPPVGTAVRLSLTPRAGDDATSDKDD